MAIRANCSGTVNAVSHSHDRISVQLHQGFHEPIYILLSVQAYTCKFSCPGVKITSDTLLLRTGDVDISQFTAAPISVTFRLNIPETISLQLPVPPRQYAIESIHGTFLRGHPGGSGSLIDLAAKRQDWEVWTLLNVGEGLVSLASRHGTLLHGWPGGAGAKVDLRGALDPREQWRLIPTKMGRFALLSCHDLLLCGHSGGDGARVSQQVYLEDWNKQAWEQWKFVAV